MLAPPETGIAEVGIEQPSLIEDGPVELGACKLGFVELGRAENGMREIEARQIEPGQPLAAEIGGRAGFRRREHGFHLRTRHFRGRHLRRVDVDVPHHVLGNGRHGKSQEADRKHPTGSSDHQRHLDTYSRSPCATTANRMMRVLIRSPRGRGARPER